MTSQSTDRTRTVRWAIDGPRSPSSAGRPQLVRDPLSVVILDDRRLYAEGLKALLEAGGAIAVTRTLSGLDPVAIDALHPELVLIGIGADAGGCLKLVSGLILGQPAFRTVIVSDAQDFALLRFTVDHEIAGLISSEMTAADLAVILDQVMQGHTALPVGWQRTLAASSPSPVGELSKRQLEVLRLVVTGLAYEEVAEQLFISVNTVKFHVRSAYLRLGVRNRLKAAALLSAYDRHRITI